jgi:hypothetical protein
MFLLIHELQLLLILQIHFVLYLLEINVKPLWRVTLELLFVARRSNLSIELQDLCMQLFNIAIALLNLLLQ